MKKILMVIPSLTSGGAERVMSTLANELCKDYNVEILTITTKDAFYKLDDDVTVSTLNCQIDHSNSFTAFTTRVKCLFKGFFGVRKAIKKKRPDAVIAFLGPAIFSTLLLKMLGCIKGKLIVSERADPTVRGRCYQFLERTLFPKADVIVCQGERVKEFFKEKDRSRCVVIPNPICADAIPPLHIGERRKCIVGVGRLVPQKNFTMLINAFAKLPERFNDYTLEIYGKGYMQTTLEKQISDLKIEHRVQLMGVKKNVMFSVSDASLFVMSSDFEGFPNALAEAMATGIPVISTDFPTGVAKEIVKEDNGIVIPMKDEEALVSAMTELLSDEERRRKMSVENRKYLDIFNEEAVADMWRAIL